MNGQRRFQRFNIDIMNVTGRIVWSNIVTIKAITNDIVILSTDARMNLGKKYILHIEHEDDGFNVSGTVISSSIDQTVLSPEGETMPLYRAEISFDTSTRKKQDDIARFIGLLTAEGRPELGRLKLWIDVPGEEHAVTESYRVKEIGIGGMRVECSSPHEVGCTFRILMTLPDVATLRMRAKVVWCIQTGGDGGGEYNIGLAFSDMNETDWIQLESFIQHLQEPRTADTDFWRHEKI